jgi:hypothetical protein
VLRAVHAVDLNHAYDADAPFATVGPEDVRGNGDVLQRDGDPTAPTGAMMCAASPSSSRPGLYQRRRRSASTTRSEVWLQVAQRLRAPGQPRDPQRHRAVQGSEPLGSAESSCSPPISPDVGMLRCGARAHDLGARADDWS